MMNHDQAFHYLVENIPRLEQKNPESEYLEYASVEGDSITYHNSFGEKYRANSESHVDAMGAYALDICIELM